MCKDLFDKRHNTGILLQQFTATAHIALEPRVHLIDLPIEDKRVDDAKEEFNDNPEIVVTGVVGTYSLDDNLDDIGRLEIDGNDIVTLVGTEEGLLIVDKVTYKRGCQEAIECRKHNGQGDGNVCKEKGQEQRQHNTRHQDDDTYPAIEVAKDGDNLIDL